MHKKQQHIYVGVDLHKQQHVAVVINCWNERLATIQFDNKPSAYPSLLELVNRYVQEGITPVFGLEDIGGFGRALAIFLKDQGQMVKEVNTTLSSAKRKAHPNVKKNDAWDAECVAKVLLDELERLPDANPQDRYWAIAQLVGRRNHIVQGLVSVKNQLHVQLSYHYPSYRKFFTAIDGKTALAFWETYPAPHLLENVTSEQLREFLVKPSNYACSTKHTEKILAFVLEDGDTKRSFQEYRNFLIQSHVREIQERQKELDKIDEHLHVLMKGMGLQLHTMHGIEMVTAAAFVAEIGDIQRFSHPDKLARAAGVAPVHFSTGGNGKDKKSRQGNRALHALFYSLAVRQIQVTKGTKKPLNPIFYEFYQRKIKEGKSKVQAIICVMRRLVNIIYGMMKHKTAYRVPVLSQEKVG